jgi:hypothetical protein
MMAAAIVEVMSDVICVLAIATKDINQSRASEFFPDGGSILFVYLSSEMLLAKLVRRTDIEVALQRLENVTAEEARRVANEALSAVEGVGRPVERNLDYLSGSRSRYHISLPGVSSILQRTDQD